MFSSFTLGTVKYLTLTLLKILSPNGDQQQFPPNNIHMLPREMVMRVNKNDQ